MFQERISLTEPPGTEICKSYSNLEVQPSGLTEKMFIRRCFCASVSAGSLAYANENTNSLTYRPRERAYCWDFWFSRNIEPISNKATTSPLQQGFISSVGYDG